MEEDKQDQTPNHKQKSSSIPDVDENLLPNNPKQYKPLQVQPKNMNYIQDYSYGDIQDPSSSFEQFYGNQNVSKQQFKNQLQIEDIEYEEISQNKDYLQKVNQQQLSQKSQQNKDNKGEDELKNIPMQSSGNRLIEFDNNTQVNEKGSFAQPDNIQQDQNINQGGSYRKSTPNSLQQLQQIQQETQQELQQTNNQIQIDWTEYFEKREKVHEEDRIEREDQMREKLQYLQKIQRDKNSFDHKMLRKYQYQEYKLMKSRFSHLLTYQQDYKQQFQKVQQLDLNELVKHKGNAINGHNSLLFIKRFVRKIKIFAPRKDYRTLKKSQIRLIGDLSFTKVSDALKKQGQKNFQKRELYQKGQSFYNIMTGKSVSEKCVTFFNKLPLILPQSVPKIVWDILIILLLIITLWMYPLDLILGKKDMHSLYGIKWATFNIVVLILYIVDIFSKFLTAFYQRAVCITEKKLIIMNYLQGWFYYDLLSLLPFILELFSIRSSFKFWNLLVFMKLPTFFQIMNNVHDIVLTKQYLQNIVQLIRLFLFVTFVAHIFGLLWLGQTELLMNNDLTENHWVLDQGLQEEYWLIKYIWCFYFAITTMTTVGYGDVTPTNEYEAILLVIGMVLATAIFAYTFNSIGQIIEDLTRESKEFKKQASLVNIYLKKKNTSSLLKLQVHKYLEYKFQSEKELSNEEEYMVMQKLPENMQEEILFEQAMYVIKSNKNIFGKFTEKIQQRLAMKIQERRYNKHENLFEQDENVNDPCLYFIQSGKIEIYTHSYKGDQQFTVQNVLKDRNSFGEYSFITGYPRTCGAQTVRASQVSFIKRSDFLEVIQKSIVDQEIYCMMRDKIIMNNSNLALGTLCYSCSQYGHFSGKCPQTHLKIDKEKVLLTEKFQNWQQRDYLYVRCERIKYHTLLDKMLINDRGEDFFYEQHQEFEEQKKKQDQELEILQTSNMKLIQQMQKEHEKKFSLIQSQNEYHMQGERQINQKRQTSHLKRLQQEQEGISYKNKYILQQMIEQKIRELQNENDSNLLSQVSESGDDQNSEDYFYLNKPKKQISYLNKYQEYIPNNKLRLIEEPLQHHMIHSNPNQKKGQYQHHHISKPKKKGLGKFLNRKKSTHDMQERKNSQIMVVSQNKYIQNESSYLNDILQQEGVSRKKKDSTKKLIFRDNNIEEETPIENNNIVDNEQFINQQQQYYQQQLENQYQNLNNQQQQYQASEIRNTTEQSMDDNVRRSSIISNNNNNDTQQYTQRQPRRSSRKYSIKFTQKIENNLKKKQEQIKHKTLQQMNLQHYNRIQFESQLIADCTIKKFDRYFPRFNFNPEEQTKQYNWAKDNVIPTPGFGIYTFYERKIRQQNYQTYQTTVVYNDNNNLQDLVNTNRIKFKKFKSPNSSVDSSDDELGKRNVNDDSQNLQFNMNLKDEVVENKEKKSDFEKKRKQMQTL